MLAEENKDRPQKDEKIKEAEIKKYDEGKIKEKPRKKDDEHLGPRKK